MQFYSWPTGYGLVPLLLFFSRCLPCTWPASLPVYIPLPNPACRFHAGLKIGWIRYVMYIISLEALDEQPYRLTEIHVFWVTCPRRKIMFGATHSWRAATTFTRCETLTFPMTVRWMAGIITHANSNLLVYSLKVWSVIYQT